MLRKLTGYLHLLNYKVKKRLMGMYITVGVGLLFLLLPSKHGRPPILDYNLNGLFVIILIISSTFLLTLLIIFYSHISSKGKDRKFTDNTE